MLTATHTEAPQASRRNKDFYFDIVTFKVENEFFRVPSLYFMKESDFFKGMFQLPVAEGAVADGHSEDQPLLLEGVLAKDFNSLLRVMFPSSVGQEETLNAEEWEGVLKLADMWQMEYFKTRAISKLREILFRDPATRIVHSRKYNIDEWLLPAYEQLVTRSDPITIEEANLIGLETTLKLCAIRESYVLKVGDDYGYGRWVLQTRRGNIDTPTAALPLRVRMKKDFGMDLELDESDLLLQTSTPVRVRSSTFTVDSP
ncbi:hypothetical protein CC1G_04664 [Coprinopsis cinerea okayama7|uniref:BTB domain-containing protein n=1 Tax=Coprinopsis cinerea (strain Okayama-7 / 130 / ATCC MYA-4618 / FGSC 9003) TaxID=240176 RepID=A8N557_COPC7|nr:hypothetical protein CC1G_04664 [Coprinopsis cinerea okayama7\|eukprot:XP_001829975.1 hypothetical protein CC1G_04664 [Coprinopsis cinerea okayama7\